MIKIKNWDKYQSYKDRKPPWIRFHRSILDDFKYQSMTAESRALLPMLWLLACEHSDPVSGLIPYELDEICFRLRISNETVTTSLHELQLSDFIECIESVTKPLHGSNEIVTPETETETETETEKHIRDSSDEESPRNNCPVSKIVDLYHEKLPELPKVEKITAKRRGYIQQRWREDLKTVESWGYYFDHIRNSEFLMGKTEPSGDRKPFIANLEWLTNPSNFAKVAEDKYHG